jgi:hypothetical protein
MYFDSENKKHLKLLFNTLWDSNFICDFYNCSDGDDKQYPDCKLMITNKFRCMRYKLLNALYNKMQDKLTVDKMNEE